MKETLITVHKFLKHMFLVSITFAFVFIAKIFQIMSFVAVIAVVFGIFTQSVSFKEVILFGILLPIALFYSGIALDVIMEKFDKSLSN